MRGTRLIWMIALVCAPLAHAESGSVSATNRASSPSPSPWFGTVAVSASTCLDRSQGGDCVSPSGTPSGVGQPAPQDPVNSAMAMELGYAVSKRLSLQLDEGYAAQPGLTDPEFGPSLNLKVGKGIRQHTSLAVTLPVSKDSHNEKKIAGTALTVGLDGHRGRTFWMATVLMTHGFFAKPTDSAGTIPPDSTELTTPPAASTLNARELSRTDFSAFVGRSIQTGRLMVRAGGFVSQMHLDVADLWIVDMTVLEVSRPLAGVMASAGLDLVSVGEGPKMPHSPELRVGASLPFGGK